VFVIAIFDPVLANNCPDPLLPVSESLPRHLAKSKPKRQSASSKIADSLGTDGQWAAGTSPDGDFLTTSVTSKWSKGSGGPSGSEYYNMVVGALAARDYKGVGNQYVSENKCVVEPVAYHFDSLSSNSMKSSNPDSGVNQVDQARTLDTWRPDPSLNQGGLAIVEPFVKSSRAQTSEDSETWISSEVNPTLNSFDQGDVRTTTAIVGSLQARDFKGVNHEGARDGKLIIEEPVLIDGQRVGDVRIYSEPVQTLGARMGTGGNNVPMLAFDTQFGSNANVTEEVSPTLKASQQSPSVAYPIQDGREIEKNQNGLGVADQGAPAYTLDQTGSQAVAYSIREDAKAGNFSATELDHANSLSALQPSPQSHHAQMFITEPTMAVRRLTPLECERLMGWPDDHTRYKADGTEQADTHRYKQCGNGVASPVAQWIAKHLIKLEQQSLPLPTPPTT
jgi:hypothetical protein